MMNKNRAYLKAMGIWEFMRKESRQIDEDGNKEFIKNSKHRSLNKFIIGGKHIEFLVLNVTKNF